MPDFGIFRGFNDKLFGDKLYAGQTPVQLGNSQTFIFSVKTDNVGVSTSTQFRMPLTTSIGLNMRVDWGDGIIENITNHTLAIHTYATAGTYTISVTGSILGWSFNNTGDRLKILNVSKWAGLNISVNNGFTGCANLTATAIDAPNITTNNLSQYFRGCVEFNGNIGSWDVSNVITFSETFDGTSKFNNGGSDSIKNWNTSNVTSFNSMFRSSKIFNQPIGNWDTSNVTNMRNMFTGAIAFNQDIGAWNTSAVALMSNMFQGATAFNQNIGSWDVSNVITFLRMFYNATAFNNGGSDDIDNWTFSTISDITMQEMFSGLNTTTSCKFNRYIGLWNTERVTLMSGMFQNNTAFNQDIGSWDVSNVTNFTNFMVNKTAANYSAANLDSIYNGWSSRPVKPNLNISFGTIKFTAAGVAGKAVLTAAPNNWTIVDGGL